MRRGRLLGLVLVCAVLATAVGAWAGAVPAPTITTVAGNGTLGYGGDGGPATDAALNHPRGIALAPGGGFVFADAFGNVVRRVWPDGHITTVAGTGTAGYSSDGGSATQAELDLPHGVAYLPDGRLLIADALNNRIRAVAPDGTISTVAGTGGHGYSGDGGPATQAEIAAPRGVTALPDGGFLIPDSDNNVIRRVAPDGTITTVAGAGGARTYGGDGGPALEARLGLPFAAVPMPDGGFLIADTGNDRVRRVAPDGTITTVAGDGVRGFGGDGGPATSAELFTPHNLAVLPDGGFLIADEGNNRVRRVWPDGTITTVAGDGTAGFSGDDRLPADAALNQPKAVEVLDDDLGFLVADAANSRVRLIETDLRRILTLSVAPQALRIKVKHQAALTVEASEPVTLRLSVRRDGKPVLGLTVPGPTATATFRFGKGLRPGTYALTAIGSGGVAVKPASALATLQIVK